jgi:DnaD/phage-associated family protein
MNYIKELNAFYDWLELNELSPSAINLWYALMHINNKAGWAETFTVAESVLCVKTGLTDRTLRKVRNELKQKGRIDFVSRKGGKAPIYKIIPFESSEHSAEINSAGSAGDSSGGRSAGSAGDSSALIKLNKTKQNETKKEKEETPVQNPFRFFEENGFGVLGGHIAEKISTWCDDLSDELVLEAMKIAVENGKVNWRYVETILQDWFTKRIRTIEQAHAAILAFKEQQSKQRTKPRQGYAPVRKEPQPEWFNNAEKATQPENDDDDDFDYEAERRKLEKELQKYKNEKVV